MPIEINALQRTNRRLWKWVVIQALSLTGVIVMYIINHWLILSPSFHGSNYDDMAMPKNENYRRGIHFPNRSMGVYYQLEDVKNYLNVYWPLLIARQEKYQDSLRKHTTNVFPYDSSKWAIGFYWMEKDRKNMFSANRHDFYVIPTLIDNRDTTKPKVIDYFDDKKGLYYHGTNTPKTQKETKGEMIDTENAVAFDEGQLWP